MKFETHNTFLESTMSIVDFLKQNHPELSKQQIKSAMQKGAVWLTRQNKTSRVRRAKKDLQTGDEVHFYYDNNILLAEVPSAKLIADEEAYSVWYKPYGMFSQGTKWADHSAICRWVEINGFPERNAFLVHRLDRATQGLILVAHQKKIASQLALLFEKRQVKKFYRAKIAGQFPILNDISVINKNIDGKQAKTIILENTYDKMSKETSLLLQIETGRKHQIRKHLAGLGCPIIGDRLYSNKDKCSNKDNTTWTKDLCLQSCYLEFVCPVENRLKKFEC